MFRILIAGGGVAALEAVLTLQELDVDRSLQVEVIAPETRFVYRPLSVRDPFGPRATRFYDLKPLVEGAGAELRHGQVDTVGPDERFVTLGDGTQLPYDALLLATGVLRRPAIRGASTFAGVADAPAFKSFVDALCRGAYRRVAFIVPPGPTWGLPMYELAMQAGARLQESSADAQLAVISPERAALEIFGPVASRAVEAALHEHGVTMHPGTYAESLQRRTAAASTCREPSRWMPPGRRHGCVRACRPAFRSATTASSRSTAPGVSRASSTSSPPAT